MYMFYVHVLLYMFYVHVLLYMFYCTCFIVHVLCTCFMYMLYVHVLCTCFMYMFYCRCLIVHVLCTCFIVHVLCTCFIDIYCRFLSNLYFTIVALQDFLCSSVYKILIISYEMYVRNTDVLNPVNFDIVICDEGHRLKNSNIKTSSVSENIVMLV